MKVRLFLLSLALCLFADLRAQTDTLKTTIEQFFSKYSVAGYRPHKSMQCDSIRQFNDLHEIRIYANEPFCSQPFTPTKVKDIYNSLQRQLPPPYNTYRLTILDKTGQAIEELVPNIYRTDEQDRSRLWGDIEYKGEPWVANASLPYRVTKGLSNRHLFIWPSHGIYNSGTKWEWQRPFLYCTTEDLLTQSFVFPYLYPMLERAGAIVTAPRERDYQTQECVVDNDTPLRHGSYTEVEQDNLKWTTSADSAGFKVPSGLLNDSTLPFSMGTYRMATATSRKSRLTTATWTPNIPATGRYAVYVSYASRPNSVPDAHYTVVHKGGRTNFKVNQQIGGGTWVYLGTYEFEKGSTQQGRVILSNSSTRRGVVTADAVRFGGGVGQTERSSAGTSGQPRFLEAARYYAQWAGVPDSLFNPSESKNDYRDDIRCRSNMLNYLAGGSCYIPGTTGRGVPFELSLALHTDAGFRTDNSIYGTLSICTTQRGKGDTYYKSGLSRMASSDFAQLLLGSLTHDLSQSFDMQWTSREHWDRNYAETRMPGVPSAILEMLSHQNFQDMKYAHDPIFKFTASRSIYKSILRFVNAEHGVKDIVVQPLPPSSFAAELSSDASIVRLSWEATPDSLESTATPTGYVLYTKVDDEAFDNGLSIGNVTEYTMNLSPGKVYAFRITAVNEGGESFPSETLCAYRSTLATSKRILIVNGFQRLSGPAWVETADSLGFDLRKDIGVPYISTTAFAGAQINFDPNASGDGKDATSRGFCGQEMVGKEYAGNTFDYTLEHGRAIAAANYSFASCSRAAFEHSDIHKGSYAAIDFIAGLEADLTYNLRPFKVFNANTRDKLSKFLTSGGALLLSGSYVGSDNNKSTADSAFVSDVLKYKFGGSARTDSTDYVIGLNSQFPIYRTPNAQHYATVAPDVLLPADTKAFSAFAYGEGQSAGIAYRGTDYRVIAMGFPFECIRNPQEQTAAMNALLKFLVE